MANVTVGTSSPVPVVVPGDALLILQNLGPGNVYMDTASNVTTGTGIKLVVDAGYEFGHQIPWGSGVDFPSAGTTIYAIADQAGTDLRTVVMS